MRYLEKFITYIKESGEDITDLSKEELEDLLIPITDLGIDVSFSGPRIITTGEFYGYKSLNIVFRNNFKLGPGGGYSEQIIDPKFWDFLEELIAFKRRLESNRVSIGMNWRHNIILTFVQKDKVEGDLLLMQELYDKMHEKTSAAKSDFVNNMSKRLYKDELKIVVTCGGGLREAEYTDRKWNGLFRGIDFSKFNVEKEITEDRWGYKSAVVTITLKK